MRGKSYAVPDWNAADAARVECLRRLRAAALRLMRQITMACEAGPRRDKLIDQVEHAEALACDLVAERFGGGRKSSGGMHHGLGVGRSERLQVGGTADAPPRGIVKAWPARRAGVA